MKSNCALKCKKCKAELAWQHPFDEDRWITSSDYEDSEICRSCRVEIEESYVPRSERANSEEE